MHRHALARPQGGSLDLHGESGLRALREAGLEAEFARLARYDDQCDAIYDHQGTLHFEHTDAGSGDRPEIDRTQLRDMLLASLPAGTVRWASKVTLVEARSDGRYRIVGDGEVTLDEVDLVVGADGAWSRVRPLVSSEIPGYTGVTFVELAVDDVDTKHPAVASLVPRGKVSAVGGTRGLIAQRSSNGHVRAYYMFRATEEWSRTGMDLGSLPLAREGLRRQLDGWAPSLLAPIDACNHPIVVRPIVALPVGHRWDHRPGVTLLGDAAHVVPPFSGEGVKLAMLDATELAALLAASAGGDWDAAVTAYEERMFVRAAEAAAGAMQGLDFVSEGALDHVLEHFRSLGA